MTSSSGLRSPSVRKTASHSRNASMESEEKSSAAVLIPDATKKLNEHAGGVNKLPSFQANDQSALPLPGTPAAGTENSEDIFTKICNGSITYNDPNEILLIQSIDANSAQFTQLVQSNLSALGLIANICSQGLKKNHNSARELLPAEPTAQFKLLSKIFALDLNLSELVSIIKAIKFPDNSHFFLIFPFIQQFVENISLKNRFYTTIHEELQKSLKVENISDDAFVLANIFDAVVGSKLKDSNVSRRLKRVFWNSFYEHPEVLQKIFFSKICQKYGKIESNLDRHLQYLCELILARRVEPEQIAKHLKFNLEYVSEEYLNSTKQYSHRIKRLVDYICDTPGGETSALLLNNTLIGYNFPLKYKYIPTLYLSFRAESSIKEDFSNYSPKKFNSYLKKLLKIGRSRPGAVANLLANVPESYLNNPDNISTLKEIACFMNELSEKISSETRATFLSKLKSGILEELFFELSRDSTPSNALKTLISNKLSISGDKKNDELIFWWIGKISKLVKTLGQSDSRVAEEVRNCFLGRLHPLTLRRWISNKHQNHNVQSDTILELLPQQESPLGTDEQSLVENLIAVVCDPKFAGDTETKNDLLRALTPQTVEQLLKNGNNSTFEALFPAYFLAKSQSVDDHPQLRDIFSDLILQNGLTPRFSQYCSRHFADLKSMMEKIKPQANLRLTQNDDKFNKAVKYLETLHKLSEYAENSVKNASKLDFETKKKFFRSMTDHVKLVLEQSKILNISFDKCSHDLFQFCSLQNIEAMSAMFFTHKTNITRRHDLPVVLDYLQELCGSDFALQDAGTNLQASAAYFLINGFEKIASQKIKIKDQISADVRCALQESKLHIEKFYTVHTADDLLELVPKDVKAIQKSITDELLFLKNNFKALKGSGVLTKENYDAKGYLLSAVQNAATDLGSLMKPMINSIEHSSDSMTLLSDIAVAGVNFASFEAAAFALAVWRSRSLDPILKLHQRRAAATLKRLLQILADLSALEKNSKQKIRTHFSEDAKDLLRNSVLNTYYSKAVLNKIVKYIKSTERFGILKKVFLKHFSSDYAVTDNLVKVGLPAGKKVLVSHIDVIPPLKKIQAIFEVPNPVAASGYSASGAAYEITQNNKINNKNFERTFTKRFEILINSLDDIESSFKNKFPDTVEGKAEAKKQFLAAINSLSFKHNNFRGTLFINLLNEFKAINDLKIRQKYVDELIAIWYKRFSVAADTSSKLPSESKHIYELRSFKLQSSADIYNWVHDLINSPSVWKDRTLAPQALHRIMLVLLNDPGLSQSDKDHIVKNLNEAMQFNEHSPMIGMYQKRDLRSTVFAAASLGYQAQSSKRDFQAGLGARALTDIPTPAVLALTVGWGAVSAITQPLIELNSLGETIASKSMLSALELVSQHIINNRQAPLPQAKHIPPTPSATDALLNIREFLRFVRAAPVGTLTAFDETGRLDLTRPQPKYSTAHYLENILQHEGLFSTLCEGQHGKEDIFLFEMMSKFKPFDANCILQLYYIPSIWSQKDLRTDEAEEFNSLLNNLMKGAQTLPQLEAVICKGLAYLLHMRDKLYQENPDGFAYGNKPELLKVCEKKFAKILHDAHKDINSPVRRLAKRPRNEAIGYRAAQRGAGGLVYGFVTGLLTATDTITQITAAIGAVTAVHGVGIGLIAAAGTIRFVANASADLYDYSENAESYVAAKNMVSRVVLVDMFAVTARRVVTYVEHLEAILSNSQYNPKYDKLFFPPDEAIGSPTATEKWNKGWKEITNDVFQYDKNANKIIKANKLSGNWDLQEKYFYSVLENIFTQAVTKETLLEGLFGFVRILSVADIANPLNRIEMMLTLFILIFHANDGPLHDLQKEGDILRVRRGYLPHAAGGALAAVGSAISLDGLNLLSKFDAYFGIARSAALQAGIATGGDLLSVLLTNAFGLANGSYGKTASFQAILKLIRSVLVIDMLKHEHLNPHDVSEQYQRVKSVFMEEVLDKNVERVRTFYNTRAYDNYSNCSKQLQKNKALVRAGSDGSISMRSTRSTGFAGLALGDCEVNGFAFVPLPVPLPKHGRSASAPAASQSHLVSLSASLKKNAESTLLDKPIGSLVIIEEDEGLFSTSTATSSPVIAAMARPIPSISQEQSVLMPNPATSVPIFSLDPPHLDLNFDYKDQSLNVQASVVSFRVPAPASALIIDVAASSAAVALLTHSPTADRQSTTGTTGAS